MTTKCKRKKGIHAVTVYYKDNNLYIVFNNNKKPPYILENISIENLFSDQIPITA